ncbi:MAG TPA: helix-turn-helix transcriptional regulator [Roseiflexaceae bacterium]|nr:helix-turn-helix transcriptional regulator [Roseiflexaceae bacterium]
MIRLRVKEVAEQQNLDIAKLARRADVAYATVYKAWHNSMTDKGVGIITLSKIARALGVRVVDLIVEDERLALHPAGPTRTTRDGGLGYTVDGLLEQAVRRFALRLVGRRTL